MYGALEQVEQDLHEFITSMADAVEEALASWQAGEHAAPSGLAAVLEGVGTVPITQQATQRQPRDQHCTKLGPACHESLISQRERLWRCTTSR